MIVVIFLIMMHHTSSQRADISVLEKLIRDAYTPLQSGVVEFKDRVQGIGTFFTDKDVLLEQIAALEKQNQELIMQNQALREDKAEAQRLRRLVNFQNASIDTYELVPARVIARSQNNWYMNLVIDKGSDQGIQKNMPVISPNGLVGRIGSVSRHSAQVDLITHREIAVGAILQETRETRGIVEGVGDSSMLRMQNIPYYSKVKQGDHVISSGLSQYYPKGIEIGTVQEIERQPDGLLLSALVKPAVNFDKLEEVLVIQSFHPLPEDVEQQDIDITGD